MFRLMDTECQDDTGKQKEWTRNATRMLSPLYISLVVDVGGGEPRNMPPPVDYGRAVRNAWVTTLRATASRS